MIIDHFMEQPKLQSLISRQNSFVDKKIHALGDTHQLDAQILTTFIWEQAKAQSRASQFCGRRRDPEITGQSQGHSSLDGNAVDSCNRNFVAVA